jgi:hypothetical protein
MTPTLLARYANQRVPRYTSYPTAPHFRPEVGSVEYGDWLADLPERTVASLYLHVPFCRSMCWYCGCHTAVARRDGPILDYVRSLRREVDLVTGSLRGSVPVRHVHFGGGTPTILPAAVFLALIDLLRDKFAISENAEIAIEIDPRTLTGEMTAALGAGGVARASLGVQCFDPMVQSAINRVQSFEETAAAVQGLRQAGIRGINLDLIYGLPHQTVSSCIDTVAQCLTLRPDRLSVFPRPGPATPKRRLSRRCWSMPATGASASTIMHAPTIPWPWLWTGERCTAISRVTRQTVVKPSSASGPPPSAGSHRVTFRTRSSSAATPSASRAANCRSREVTR